LDTKCDWCQPENKTESTEIDSVTIPEDCPLEICGICYPEGLPLANARNSTCRYGTSRFGGYCACWSGAFGKECSMGNALSQKIIPQPWKEIKNENYLNLDLNEMADIHFEKDWSGHVCAQFIEVTPLETVAPPVIESASFSGNKLDMRISHSMANGRAETIVYLNAGHENEHCIYPLSNYISKEVEECKDVWHFELPWNLSSSCNWRVLEEETHISYCGQVILQMSEWMENICEWRFVQSVLNIKIRFQRFVRIEVEAVVANKPEIASAITNQIVLVNCPEPVLIEITSLVNWPYKLDTNFNLSLYPRDKIVSYELEFDDCSEVSENVGCRQRWRTSMDLSASACTLDGAYQLSFPKVMCHSDSDCPLREEDQEEVKIDYNLLSENFCAVVKVDISLSATIKVYEDAEFTKERSLFLLGQKAYYKISARSDLSGSSESITFTSIKIKSVTLRGVLSNLPVYIVEQGKPTTVSGLTGEESVNYQLVQLNSKTEIGFCNNFVISFLSKKEK